MLSINVNLVTDKQFQEYLANFFFFKHIINYFLAYTIIFVVIFGFLSIFFRSNYFNKFKITSIFKSIKIFYKLYFLFYFILLLLKLIIKIFYLNYYYNFINLQNMVIYCSTSNFLSLNFLNGGLLSDAIVLLAFLTGSVCIYLLSDKDLDKLILNIFYFNIFLIIITLMVYTNNLLVMFICFELIFLPTIYFVWNIHYSKKVDKTIKFLFIWTFFGTLLILFCIGYIYKSTNTLLISSLMAFKFSFKEQIILFILIFFGFGIKIPVFPFHFWLTKVHVEASAGFSIFLSGFLVKTSLYCFYMFFLMFKNIYIINFLIIISLIGVCEASLKMWVQTDIKKLIAYATIQEMNLILFLLLIKDTLFMGVFIVFIIMHGILSTLMFFTVDIIQKRFNTRNISQIQNIAVRSPALHKNIIIILLIFTGFPLSIKFFIEFILFDVIIQQCGVMGIFFLILGIISGSIGFAKIVFSMLYGSNSVENVNLDLTRKEKYFFNFLFFLIFVLFFICFYI